MRCPFCGFEDTQVKDSRSSEDGSAIRRRRACPKCQSRFTTFERIQLRELSVIKKNGQRRPFDREKLLHSINLAVRKRDISLEQIESTLNNIIRNLEGYGEGEIPTEIIGQAVMSALIQLDKVAYIRYASVYKEFREAKDFGDFVNTINT